MDTDHYSCSNCWPSGQELLPRNGFANPLSVVACMSGAINNTHQAGEWGHSQY